MKIEINYKTLIKLFSKQQAADRTDYWRLMIIDTDDLNIGNQTKRWKSMKPEQAARADDD